VRGRRRSNPPANLTYLNVPLSPDRHGHSRGPRTHQITHLSRLRETNAVRPIYSRYWGASGVADLRLQNVQDSRDGSDEAESAARIWPNGGPKTKSHLSAATRTICFADRTDRRPSSVRHPRDAVTYTTRMGTKANPPDYATLGFAVRAHRFSFAKLDLCNRSTAGHSPGCSRPGRRGEHGAYGGKAASFLPHLWPAALPFVHLPMSRTVGDRAGAKL
jgi:hypothetical protein